MQHVLLKRHICQPNVHKRGDSIMAKEFSSCNEKTSDDPNLIFVDLRSEEERQIEREANAGASLCPEADPLLEELMKIGQTCDFISDPGGNYNENGQHRRAREIGITLNRIGGIELMQAIYYRISVGLSPARARSLEFAWSYIGHWLP